MNFRTLSLLNWFSSLFFVLISSSFNFVYYFFLVFVVLVLSFYWPFFIFSESSFFLLTFSVLWPPINIQNTVKNVSKNKKENERNLAREPFKRRTQINTYSKFTDYHSKKKVCVVLVIKGIKKATIKLVNGTALLTNFSVAL